ncbi:MAG TPA: hypothetical protein VN326_02730, partial [Casimicrobiaceae bacterium]|nr:hypothetical protein [Casimicrobiaceae bacterium]
IAPGAVFALLIGLAHVVVTGCASIAKGQNQRLTIASMVLLDILVICRTESHSLIPQPFPSGR